MSESDTAHTVDRWIALLAGQPVWVDDGELGQFQRSVHGPGLTDP